MTFHTYNPSTDTLEVGTKIRLAGREGEITYVYEDTNIGRCFKVEWDADDENVLYLQLFDIEIADEPAKPLTIDKRVKEEIIRLMKPIIRDIAMKVGRYTWESVDDLNQYLDSLEEV